MSHTEGKLEVVTDCPGECCWHIQQVGNTDEFNRLTSVEMGEEDARRLVACWNEHDELVAKCDELKRERDELMVERNEIVKTLRDTADKIERRDFAGPIPDARAIITKYLEGM